MRYRQIQKFWDRAKTAAEKVFDLMNWSQLVYGTEKEDILSLIWIVYKKTLTEGIDRLNETSYNIRKSLTN